MAVPGATHKGWWYDRTNARLVALFNGTEIFDFDGDDVTFTATTNLSGAQTYGDDVVLGLGAPDAKFLWETADANANKLLLELPAGGATNVPVVVIGDTLVNDDPAIYDGVVSTTVGIHGSTATATGPAIHFRKSRGTNSAPTVVTSGDDMGSIDFFGAVAADEWVRGARILAEMTGTIATTRGPGVLTFQTATDAAPSVLTTAMTISAAQLVTVAAGLTATTGHVTVTAGNAVLGTPGAFATTQSVAAVKMGGPTAGGTNPVGAIATSGAIFSSDTVVQKIIANGTVSNVET